MRSSEWISVGFFSVFLVAGALAPLEGRRRRRAIGIGLTGIAAAGGLHFLGDRPTLDVIRDLVPGGFLLMGYWQSGQFFRGANPRLQRSLQRVDERWFPGVLRIAARLKEHAGLAAYLEVAYLMCYPVVPLGIIALYMAGHGEAADRFWRVVLPPTFLCYGLTVLFPSLPPRLVVQEGGLQVPRSGLRSLNVQLLERAGIRANTLPSGHVASSTAIALVLLGPSPIAGALFLWIAGSITVATAVLRYHYSIDAVLGIALALLSFVILG